jgi:hypothetical protein
MVTRAKPSAPVETIEKVEKPKFKFPKSLGACADRLYSLRGERLAAQKIADALEAEEKALKAHIINTLPKSEASGIAGKLCRITVVSKEIPQVKDWDKFYKFMGKKKTYDFLQRRLNDSLVKEYWDDGKTVDGVEAFIVKTVSMNKL